MQRFNLPPLNAVRGTLKGSVASALLGLSTLVPAHAVETLSFQSITNSSLTNSTAGAAQLFVDVADPSGANNVLFTFRNMGPALSSITDVYFDDGTLLGIANIFNGTGVSFSQGAVPLNLPGANNISPAFEAIALFSADANVPVSLNGVNPGESFSILFNLQTGQEYSSVLAELENGDLRVGLHVQSFGNGGSESFVNTPLIIREVAAIPEPSTMAFFAFGVLLLGALGRKTGLR